jgi:hypothetical protein
LTPAGELFFTEARQTLAQAERAVRAAHRAERGELGELVVGYVTSAIYAPLPDVIRTIKCSSSLGAKRPLPSTTLSSRSAVERPRHSCRCDSTLSAILEGRSSIGRTAN